MTRVWKQEIFVLSICVTESQAEYMPVKQII